MTSIAEAELSSTDAQSSWELFNAQKTAFMSIFRAGYMFQPGKDEPGETPTSLHNRIETTMQLVEEQLQEGLIDPEVVRARFMPLKGLDDPTGLSGVVTALVNMHGHYNPENLPPTAIRSINVLNSLIPESSRRKYLRDFAIGERVDKHYDALQFHPETGESMLFIADDISRRRFLMTVAASYLTKNSEKARREVKAQLVIIGNNQAMGDYEKLREAHADDDGIVFLPERFISTEHTLLDLFPVASVQRGEILPPAIVICDDLLTNPTLAEGLITLSEQRMIDVIAGLSGESYKRFIAQESMLPKFSFDRVFAGQLQDKRLYPALYSWEAKYVAEHLSPSMIVDLNNGGPADVNNYYFIPKA